MADRVSRRIGWLGRSRCRGTTALPWSCAQVRAGTRRAGRIPRRRGASALRQRTARPTASSRRDTSRRRSCCCGTSTCWPGPRPTRARLGPWVLDVAPEAVRFDLAEPGLFPCAVRSPPTASLRVAEPGERRRRRRGSATLAHARAVRRRLRRRGADEQPATVRRGPATAGRSPSARAATPVCPHRRRRRGCGRRAASSTRCPGPRPAPCAPAVPASSRGAERRERDAPASAAPAARPAAPAGARGCRRAEVSRCARTNQWNSSSCSSWPMSMSWVTGSSSSVAVDRRPVVADDALVDDVERAEVRLGAGAAEGVVVPAAGWPPARPGCPAATPPRVAIRSAVVVDHQPGPRRPAGRSSRARR